MYGWSGLRENARLRPLFHREAEVHHHHLVRDVADHGQVVRNEEVGEPELVLEVGEQVEDLRLHRDVERGNRLVGNDQRRIQHQRARDRNPLPLPAREHVRIARVVFGAQSDLGEDGACALRALGRALGRVDLERSFEDLTDLLARVERAVGVLEDHLDGLLQLASLRGRGPNRVHAGQLERPLRRRLDQRHDAPERRFAATGFADDGQRARVRDLERDAAHGLERRRRTERAAADRVGPRQVLGANDEAPHPSPLPACGERVPAGRVRGVRRGWVRGMRRGRLRTAHVGTFCARPSRAIAASRSGSDSGK